MTITLTIHIILAIITTISLCVVATRTAWKKSSKTSLAAMWASFGLTSVSGVYLVFITPQALTHTCIILSGYVVAVSLAHIYSRRLATI